MKKCKDYMTITSSYSGYDLEGAAQEFDIKVKNLMKNGWVPQGGVSMSSYRVSGGEPRYNFAQTIVLLED